MDFREYAANETTTAIHELLATSAEVSREQLQSLRAFLEATTKALESALQPSSELERNTNELVDRLTKAANGVAERAARSVSEAAKKVQDDLTAQLQAKIEEKDALVGSLNGAQAESEVLRGELKTALQHAEATGEDLAQARSALEQLEAARLALTAARDDEARGRIAAEQALQTTRELVVALREELGTAIKTAEQAVAEKATAEDAMSGALSQAQAADAKLAAVSDLLKTNAVRLKTLERAQVDQDRTIRDLEARLKAAPGPVGRRPASMSVSLVEELLAGFQTLGTAKTIPDVLTTLVEQLAAQFSRVALFRMKTNHLQGEHQIGFDSKTDIAKVVMPLGMESLLTRSVQSGHIERLSDRELKDSSRALFSGTPTCALALPVVVGAETLAVVYADDSGAAPDETGPDAIEARACFADAMLQHALALLLGRTNELKALAELRAYATSLVQEIEQMYVSDVGAGKSGQELQSRLKANVEYARSIYTNRVSLEGADAAALLDDQLAALVESQNDTPFARDLALIIGGRKDNRRSAEAS
jgi:hypothetical protein